jgi:hypothetical protein
MSTLSSARIKPTPDQIEAVALRLWTLLPGIYRTMDDALVAPAPGLSLPAPAAPSGPLAGFLRVLAQELCRLEGAIEALDDDHFVERASPDALPRLAELLGVQLLGDDPRINRGVVAKSVGWRRRKGTPATLEEMLSVTTGWAVDAHEGFKSLMVTQDVNNVVPSRGVLVDVSNPIPLADPISRRTGLAGGPSAAPPALAILPGETVDEALRRLGRVDAGQPAVSPRTLDLLGWARPEAVLVRTAQLVPIELQDMPGHETTTVAGGPRVLALDPLGRPTPLVWLEPAEAPELLGGLTAVHEPDTSPPAPVRRSASLLTPTALAADPDGAEAAGALALSIAGVPLIGPDPVPGSGGPMAYAPLGPAPLLGFVDPGRLGSGDDFLLELFALRSDDGPIDPTVDVLLASAEATPGVASAVTTTPDSALDMANGVIGLRVTRRAGGGSLRTPAPAPTPPATTPSAPTWTAFSTTARSGRPLGNATLLTTPGGVVVVRPEQAAGATTVQIGVLDASGATPWRAVELPGGPAAVDGIAATSDGTTLYLVVPDGASIAIWSVQLGPPAKATRLDDPAATTRPTTRADPSLLFQPGSLYLFGGTQNGVPIGELWTFSLTSNTFTFYLVRNPQARAGATLLWQWGSPVLLGGESVAGQLDPTVWRADLQRQRPRWVPLPSLPARSGAPGRVFARAVNGGVQALVWGDRTRPFSTTLAADQSAWSIPPPPSQGGGPTRAPALEGSPAPNPPAEGEALFDGDNVLVIGPPPLPPSEVVFTVGGTSRLAFLPSLDLAPGESALFTVEDDGTTARRFVSLQEAAGRTVYGALAARAGGPFRLNVPGHLAAKRFVLRQRFYGPWTTPLSFPDGEDVVGLDPRDGRAVVPASAPPGPITATYRVGRGALLGAGAMPQNRGLPSFWEEPGAPAPIPPDLRPGGSTVVAYVDPSRAGLTLPGFSVDVPIFADPAAALASASGVDHPVVGILGSPALDPAAISGGSGSGFSLNAIDPAHAPFFRIDPAATDPLSIGVYPDFGGSSTTEMYLAGLWLQGRLDLVMAAGQADVRWCTIGQPGVVSVRVPGGGDDPPPTRSPQSLDVELRLYGCVLGAVEIPPWVRLVAAGCIFDGGAGGRAIRASGAEVHLRQCTVRGSVEAGRIYASSCAFAGAVRASRVDLGWIRYSLLPVGPGQPVLHQCLDRTIAFASGDPAQPNYLVLADANGTVELTAGEMGRVPGAHGERTDRLRELTTRTELQLPIGMVAVHVDRVTNDLAQMGRSSP